MEFIKRFFSHTGKPRSTGLEILRYIGPGLIVTVGFIDPGNWASNVAAGSSFGYKLLWIVSLSTVMLIFLQHNAAHLGIATGLCLSEAATQYLRPWISRVLIGSAVLASISTALAEILGGAIALNMIFNLPVKIGSVFMVAVISWMLFTNSYRRVEKFIIGFVSLIGLSFIFELGIVDVDWGAAANGWLIPSIPDGSMLIIMSVLGAVVMPHNLFLHSEIIQSRQWNLEDDKTIKRQLKYEFIDTLFSMFVGWAINSAMILVAAATFYNSRIAVNDLAQAKDILTPLAGTTASIIFAVALLLAGIASCVTAGMAGGSIFAGLFKEPYNIGDRHSKTGVGITLFVAQMFIFFINDSFKGLLYSQMFLSMQLPFTVFLLLYLTSSKKIMGKYANSLCDNIILWTIVSLVTVLNIMLLVSFF